MPYLNQYWNNASFDYKMYSSRDIKEGRIYRHMQNMNPFSIVTMWVKIINNCLNLNVSAHLLLTWLLTTYTTRFTSRVCRVYQFHKRWLDKDGENPCRSMQALEYMVYEWSWNIRFSRKLNWTMNLPFKATSVYVVRF